MKAYLFLIFFCLGINCIYAQKNELGISTGLSFNSVPKTILQKETSASPSFSNPLISVKVAHNFRNWQAGISVSIMQFSYHLNYYDNVDPLYPSFPSFGHYKYVIANPAIPISLFLNKKFNSRYFKFYGGIAAGYVNITNKEGVIHNNVIGITGNKIGFTAGGQFGCTYFINWRIGINAEIGCAYMHLLSSETISTIYEPRNAPLQYNILTVPFTLGVHYRL